MNNQPQANAGIKVTQILNAQLETFERAALLRQPAEAGALLLELIDRLRGGADFIGFTTDDPLKGKLYTRLAAAIVAMLADPGFQFSTQGWAMFAVNHPAIQAIFECSAFDTAEHLTPALIGNPEERDARRYRFDSPRALAKYLLTYCLNGTTEINFDELFGKTAKTTLPLWLGMLAHHVCLHPNSHGRREALADTGRYFESIALPDGLLPALADAYMYCSYLTRPDKHALKDSFGRMIRNMVGKLIAVPSDVEIKLRRSVSLAKSKKGPYQPTILVPLEWWNSMHAMARCYEPTLRQLRSSFRLVASIKESAIDEKAREDFDDFLWLPAEGNVALDDLVRRIGELAPDIIFYPSIGMALWWVALAQMRLAPIQVMSLGHPASSRSPAIDYVLADRGMALPSEFTERILEMPENSFQFVRRPDTVIPEQHRRNQDDPINIAVPAMVVKLSVPFLQVCRCINERAGRRIVFHFFPNVLGLWRFQALRQLERWLPGCVVHHRYDYPQYLVVLSKCDLVFSTFPFGGTNSLVDSFLCGVPVVALEGPEVHGRCDAWALRRVGLADLVAKTTEMYEGLAIKLIQDDVVRQHWSDHLRATNSDAIFHGELQPPAAGAALRAFQYIFKNHELIQASSDQVVKWEGQL